MLWNNKYIIFSDKYRYNLGNYSKLGMPYYALVCLIVTYCANYITVKIEIKQINN